MITVPAEVFRGIRPVTPTPLPEPEYVAHSSTFFKELGLSDELAHGRKISPGLFG